MRDLVQAGFLICPKSVLDPVQLVSFLGKALNLASRTVACHTQALVQLWAGWMQLALGDGGGLHLGSYLGLPDWHVRPRGLGCPFGAGAWCWLRWVRTVEGERQPSHGLRVKILESLATLAALAAEPWAAPARRAWPHLAAFNFGSGRYLTPATVWAGDMLACVDGIQVVGGLVRLCPSWESDLSTRPHAGMQVNKQLSCTRWHGLHALRYACIEPRALSVVIVKWLWPKCSLCAHAATSSTNRQFCGHWPESCGFRVGAVGSAARGPHVLG